MNINKKLLRYVKTMYLYVVIVGILGLLTALCIIAQANFIAQIINAAFLLKQSLASLQGAFTLLLVVLLIRALLIWGGEAITNAVSCRVKSDLRGRLFAYLFKAWSALYRGRAQRRDRQHKRRWGRDARRLLYSVFPSAHDNADYSRCNPYHGL